MAISFEELKSQLSEAVFKGNGNSQWNNEYKPGVILNLLVRWNQIRQTTKVERKSGEVYLEMTSSDVVISNKNSVKSGNGYAKLKIESFSWF